MHQTPAGVSQKTTVSAVAAMLLCTTGAVAAPPVIDAISPEDVVQNTIPQPAITITGSGFVVGLPSPTNRPTVTLAHVGSPTQFSTLGNVNFAGTQITIPAGLNEFNLLQAPFGAYDLTITRPDAESTTFASAFEITDGTTDAINIKHIGLWGGAVKDVDVVGNYAYLANGRAFRILDISNPADVQEVGVLEFGAVAGVRVRGNYAYVAVHKPFRFSVVDVSDPTDPQLIWNAYERNGAPTPAISPEDIHFFGNYAYVRSRDDIEIFDISDPHNVITHGIFLWTIVGQMTIHGDYLYVGTRESGQSDVELLIYDLSVDPLAPSLIGSVPASNSLRTTTSLTIDGNHVFWNASGLDSSALHVVDVSDPTDPAILATRSGLPTGVRGLVFTNGHLYATDPSSLDNPLLGDGLVIYNAADPTQPQVVGNYKPHGSVSGVRIFGNRAYVFDKGEGLIILDISDPTQPVRLGCYHSPAVLRQSVKNEDRLYIADAWHGFTVLDISDPSRPTYVSDYQAEHFDDLGVDAYGIAYHDNRIYLGAGHLGLEIVDVSEHLSEPVLVAAHRIPPSQAPCSWYWGVNLTVQRNGDVIAHVGYKEFIPSCDAQIGQYLAKLINLSTTNQPANPLIGEVDLQNFGSNPIRKIAMRPDGAIFIGRMDGLLEIIDNADFADPELVHFDFAIDGTIDVAVDGDVLYTVNNNRRHDGLNRGLYIHDVSDLSQPIELVHINDAIPGGPPGREFRHSHTVAVQNRRVYATARSLLGNELFLFDVADPTQPVFLDIAALPISLGEAAESTSATLLADEPYLYHTSGPSSDLHAGGGLMVFEVENLPESIPGDIAEPFGVVDVFDLLELLNNWGTSGPGADIAPPTDTVDVFDLLMLISNWG